MQKKLSFLILMVIIPSFLLVYIGEEFVRNKISRIELGIEGLALIEKIWSASENINLITDVSHEHILEHHETESRYDTHSNILEQKIDKSSFTGKVRGVKLQKRFQEKLNTVFNREKPSKKRLLSAQRLIFDLANLSDLIGLSVNVSPELASMAFDRLPELSFRLEILSRLANQFEEKDSFNHSDSMAFMVNAGQFKSVADYISRISRVVESSIGSNTSDELAVRGATFRQRNKNFQGIAARVAREIGNGRYGSELSIDKLMEAERLFDLAISKYWRELEGVFHDKLLSEQKRLWLVYWILLTGLSSFLLILLSVAWYLRASIVNQNWEVEKMLARTKEQNQALLEREKQLKSARDKAKSSEVAKSEFLANMSHEIRTPMNGVMGMAELLRNSELNDKQKMFADIIVKSGDALLTIINDILDFSKIDAVQMELDPAPFKLTEAMEDVATLVSSKAAEKNLELSVRIAPSLPDMVIGDVGRLRQIVTNLLGNAVKFTDNGSVALDVEGNINEDDILLLCVKVKDSGVGISPEKCAQIFEKFSQVDTSATRKHEGTGLGLAIAASLVELMDGEINVESEIGVGSTFWFNVQLPIHASNSIPDDVHKDLAGARLLIVDDNDVNRAILKEKLLFWSFDCAAVCSGNEALAVMRVMHEQELQLDAVILDYHMPMMSGACVVSAMREDPRLEYIPVIMLTSVDQLCGQNELSSLGIQGHLIKPARASLLREMIIEVLQQSIHKKPNSINENAQVKFIADLQGHNSDVLCFPSTPMEQIGLVA